MLSLKYIRNNPEAVKQKLSHRNISSKTIDLLLNLDSKKRLLTKEVDLIKQKKNKFNKEISKLNKTERQEKIKQLSELVAKEKKMLKIIESSTVKIQKILSQLPNLPADDVKLGRDENENEIIKNIGIPKKFSYQPKDHLDLGRRLGIINTKKASEISGTRFNYLLNEATLIQFALIQFALSTLTNEKKLSEIAKKAKLKISTKTFTPVIPPVMVREEVLKKMGRLEPKEERYYLPKDKLYLVGSAEHSLGPLLSGKIIPEEDLPLRLVGYSTAFRRESGSYGKDTRGIFRVHQFDKIEMETFSLPENSIAEQDFIIAIQEYFMSSLGIPYQLVKMCTGDMTTPDARQVDLESWIPSQNRYRETHTSDLTTDYQSRELNIKYKKKNGEKGFVHMNDATAFAIGRTLIAIIENYQLPDGSIEVPKALRPFMNKVDKIRVNKK